jgi:hypothetical protein
VDFNSDGILDFILGERNGYYNFYTGNGDGTLHAIGHPWDNAGDPIERNYNSAGYLVDWNEDGCIDFIAGGYQTESTSGGLLEVYLNTGDYSTSPVWDASAIDLTSSVSNKWRLTHETYDLDGDGDKDMILGYEMGNVWFAENIGTNADPQFNGCIQLTCDGGNIDVYANYSGGGRARENVCDYNADGVADLLVGCSNGWVYHFQGYYTGTAEESSASVASFGMMISEIPTTGAFSLMLSLPVPSSVTARVYDSSGRMVRCGTEDLAPTGSIQFDISDLPSGMYTVTAEAGGAIESAGLVKID